MLDKSRVTKQIYSYERKPYICQIRWIQYRNVTNYVLYSYRARTLKYFYWPLQGGASFVNHLCYSCLVLLCFHVRLFVDALRSPVEKGLISWLSFMMSNCDVVTFPFVSWIRCGAWLYLFLIFALFLLSLFGSFKLLKRRFIYYEAKWGLSFYVNCLIINMKFLALLPQTRWKLTHN